MLELEPSNLDDTSHGITPVSEVISTPESTPTPITSDVISDVISDPIPVLKPVLKPDPTLDPMPVLKVVLKPEPTPDLTLDPPSSSIVTNIVSDIVEQTLVELVKKSLENEEMKKQISISLTPEVISIINNIISLTPDTLTDIEKVIIEIIKDGKIDSKDIPNIIVVIQRIYQFIYSLKTVKFDTKKRADITAITLKYILHLLVLERKIKIDEDKQTEFFAQIDLLIDSCIDLLSYSKSLQTKGCFKKLFG